MGEYFLDVCMQYPLVWIHLQRPEICVQISSMFVPNILLRGCTAVKEYVLHISSQQGTFLKGYLLQTSSRFVHIYPASASVSILKDIACIHPRNIHPYTLL